MATKLKLLPAASKKPNEDWLQYVVTAKAKAKIKDALKEEKRKIAEDGKYILQRKIEGMGAAFTPGNIDEVAMFYKLSSHLDLLYKIAVKNIDLKELKDFQVIGNRLEQPKQVVVEKPEQPAYDPNYKPLTKKDTELIIFGESSDQIQYELAKCCKPIPGDNVFGFVSTGKGMVIHRTNCPNAPQLMANYGHRIVRTKWAKNKEISFLTGLKIIGMDDVGVINKITTIISGDMRINIAGLSIESDAGIFEGMIKVFVHDKEELEELVVRLKSLDGIQSVDRFDTEE